MDKPLVSVIVPIYNGGVYLARCIASIRAQSYENLEILLINDGSCDNVSLPLVQMYAHVDPRIRVFDKPNSGVSSTRNLGIRMATGKYLQFVDCDDYLEPDATEAMVEAAERNDVDLIIAPYAMVWPKKHGRDKQIIYQFLPLGEMSQKAFLEKLMEKPSTFYFDVLWNKLYRRDIILDHDIRFDENLHWCEDAVFNFQYFRYIRSVYALGQLVYHYWQNPNSACHTFKNPFSMIRIRKEVFRVYLNLFQEADLYQGNRLKLHGFPFTVTENVRMNTHHKDMDHFV